MYLVTGSGRLWLATFRPGIVSGPGDQVDIAGLAPVRAAVRPRRREQPRREAADLEPEPEERDVEVPGVSDRNGYSGAYFSESETRRRDRRGPCVKGPCGMSVGFSWRFV